MRGGGDRAMLARACGAGPEAPGRARAGPRANTGAAGCSGAVLFRERPRWGGPSRLFAARGGQCGRGLRRGATHPARAGIRWGGAALCTGKGSCGACRPCARPAMRHMQVASHTLRPRGRAAPLRPSLLGRPCCTAARPVTRPLLAAPHRGTPPRTAHCCALRQATRFARVGATPRAVLPASASASDCCLSQWGGARRGGAW
jgi:hypothetical protein